MGKFHPKKAINISCPDFESKLHSCLVVSHFKLHKIITNLILVSIFIFFTQSLNLAPQTVPCIQPYTLSVCTSTCLCVLMLVLKITVNSGFILFICDINLSNLFNTFHTDLGLCTVLLCLSLLLLDVSFLPQMSHSHFISSTFTLSSVHFTFLRCLFLLH